MPFTVINEVNLYIDSDWLFKAMRKVLAHERVT